MDKLTTFKPLPLIARGSFVSIINKNISQKEIFFKIEEFKKIIYENKNYAEKDFEWWIKEKKQKLPLVIKYLYSQIGNIVPFEEINQIEAMEAHLEGKDYNGTNQSWHVYTDNGFDVMTNTQWSKLFPHQERKKIKSTKGLILISIRHGAKYETRKIDQNDPLDWERKKKEFNNQCAVCGATEGLFGGKNNIIVRLEKGHIDPRVGMSHSNIIPQCGSCNNHRGDQVYGPSQHDPKRWTIVETITKKSSKI